MSELGLHVLADGRVRETVREDVTVRVRADGAGWVPLPLADVPALAAGGLVVHEVASVEGFDVWFAWAPGIFAADLRRAGTLLSAVDAHEFADLAAELALGIRVAGEGRLRDEILAALAGSSLPGVARRFREATERLSVADQRAIAAGALIDYLAESRGDGWLPGAWFSVAGVDAQPVDGTRRHRRAKVSAAVLAAFEAESFGTGVDSPRSSRRPQVTDPWQLHDYADSEQERLSWRDPVSDEVLGGDQDVGDLPEEWMRGLLTPREFEAVVLRAEGHTVGQVALLMGVRDRHARRLLRSAETRLRAALGEGQAPPAALT